MCLCEQKLNDESILRSQLDMKTPHHSVSGRSYLASTPDSSNVAVFEVRPTLYDMFATICLVSDDMFGLTEFWFC